MQKIGLDNYLKSHSIEKFHELPRVRLDDPRFEKARQWHEKWIRRQEAKNTTSDQTSIDVNHRHLPTALKAAWQAIIKSNNLEPWIFRFGNALCRIERDDMGAAFVSPLDVESLKLELAERIHFVKTTHTAQGSFPTDATPPMFIINGILASPEKPVPVLARLVTTPVFGPDGSLRTTPGFCRESGILYLPTTSVQIPPVLVRPGIKEIKEAKEVLLKDFLGDFPFETESDEAHALALLLTHPARALIKGSVPLYVVDAPVQGTGKSLFASSSTRLWAGNEVSPMTEAGNDEEWRKRIFSSLRRSPSHIIFDNIKNRLSSSALEAALTTDFYEDRILGSSKNSSVPVRSIFIATGNNVLFSSEMIRRTVRIRLNSKTPQPWLRKSFKHDDLKNWVDENRPRLMWATYTLIQAWIAAGRPPGDEKIGSFESWSYVIGGILKTCGIPGFLKNIQQFYAEADMEKEDYEGLVQAWWCEHGRNHVAAAQLLPLARQFLSDFEDGSERSQQTRFGLLLNKIRGRVFNDLTVFKCGSINGLQTWRLKKPMSKSGKPGGLRGRSSPVKKFIVKKKLKVFTRSPKSPDWRQS